MTTDQRFDRIDQYLLELREEVVRRLDVIDHRLEMLSATVANVDSRLPPLTKAMLDTGTLSAQLVREQSDLVARVAKLEEKVSKLMDSAA